MTDLEWAEYLFDVMSDKDTSEEDYNEAVILLEEL